MPDESCWCRKMGRRRSKTHPPALFFGKVYPWKRPDSEAIKILRLSEKLTRFIADLNKEDENYRVKLYRHLTVETDWSFHIHIQTEINFNSPSQLGLRIASALQEFGLVHHSVWSEEKGRKK